MDADAAHKVGHGAEKAVVVPDGNFGLDALKAVANASLVLVNVGLVPGGASSRVGRGARDKRSSKKQKKKYTETSTVRTILG